METEPADPAELEQAENEMLLAQVWEEHFFEQLGKLGCSALIDEAKWHC